MVQATLLFGAETLVLTAVMLQKRERVHLGFLQQVAGMTDLNLGVDTWQNEGADRVIHTTSTNPLQGYIQRRQAKVAE